ncbi:hypothetical protein C8R44DRAFT_736015 [Mycena epipterygia]|nr:hypothetical protein C8R44DRAFT_736015 [Mycena epipterygia]
MCRSLDTRLRAQKNADFTPTERQLWSRQTPPWQPSAKFIHSSARTHRLGADSEATHPADELHIDVHVQDRRTVLHDGDTTERVEGASEGGKHIADGRAPGVVYVEARVDHAGGDLRDGVLGEGRARREVLGRRRMQEEGTYDDGEGERFASGDASKETDAWEMPGVPSTARGAGAGAAVARRENAVAARRVVKLNMVTREGGRKGKLKGMAMGNFFAAFALYAVC